MAVHAWRQAGGFVSALAVSPPALAQQPREIERVDGRDAAAGEVLVKLRAGATLTPQQLSANEDAEESRGVGNFGLIRIKSRSRSAAQMVQELRSNRDIELAEPNYIVYAIAVPNDYYFSLLWGMQNTGQTIQGQAGVAGADIEATKAWDITTGSRANAVGVVDTGVDYTHPDIAANVWSSPAAYSITLGGATINCGAGTHGFNAINMSCNPMDDNNHGTHVSGTIGGVGTNGIGVAGVNWTASIVGLKFLNAQGSGTTSDAINAIGFAAQLKSKGIANVRVLSNSWGGGGFSQSLLNAINDADANDILFVAAAGNAGANNDTTPNYPSNYAAPNVIAVAATDNRDALASFSNYGASKVHLGAPGVNIASLGKGGAYLWMSGTSMATPHVSGAAALLLSKCAANTADLKRFLVNNTDLVAALTGKTISGGRLNVYRALNACAPSPVTPDFTISATTPASVPVGGGSTTSTITIGAVNGFAGQVALSAAGAAGITYGFGSSPVTAPGTSTLTITVGSSVPAGTYPVTATGTSGALVHSTTVNVTVAAPASFSLAVSPTSRTVKRGSSTRYTVTVTPSGGFSSLVTLTVSGLPDGATGSFRPTQVTSGNSTLTIQTTSLTLPGTSTLTVSGSGGGQSTLVRVQLTVR